MRKIAVLFLAAVLLSGCATYKFERGDKPYDSGYVALRRGYTIPEYTVGKDNTVPANLELAKERFRRRHKTVEYYYKRMGLIENTFKETFLNPPKYMFQAIAGIFRLPFIARSDYRAKHDPAYRASLMQRELEKEAREDARVMSLKEALGAYIQNDLALEAPAQSQAEEQPAAASQPQAPEQPVTASPSQSPVPEQPAAVPQTQSPAPAVERAPVLPGPVPAAVKPAGKKSRAAAKAEVRKSAEPVAVIVARPVSGISPLTVVFSGARSYSPRGKIVSYQWDFGDGDIAYKARATNTYYSVTFGPKNYTATLTVRDNAGKTAQASVNIEVLNK